jgi:hypothetical protein
MSGTIGTLPATFREMPTFENKKVRCAIRGALESGSPPMESGGNALIGGLRDKISQKLTHFCYSK